MKFSRKIFTSLFVSSILVTQANAINANEWDYWAIKTNADAAILALILKINENKI